MSIVPLDQPPLRGDQINMEQPSLWPFFARVDRQAIGDSHRDRHGYNSARFSFRGNRTPARRCNIAVTPCIGSLSSWRASKRPFPQ